MGKKGVSAEEKSRRILEIYQRKGDVYNLKEIEKLGSKAGVIEQTIKDVNQALVDDGKVMTEKIGSGNFYWSFPSQALVDKQEKLSQLEGRLDKSKRNADHLEERLGEAQLSRQPSEERTASLERLKSLTAEKARLAATIDSQKEHDPEQVEQSLSES